MRLRKTKKDKKGTDKDYLHISKKEKWREIGLFILKWGGIILASDIFISLILGLFHYSPWFFFERTMILIPAIILFIGGCIGGLGRYHPAPRLRIIEPEDQSVIPPNFRIRIKFDPQLMQKESIELLVNDSKIPFQIDNDNIAIAPKIFKSPPKKAVSLHIKANYLDPKGKKLYDTIKVICDPDEDIDDYTDYWEFKKETYWSKESKEANRTAKQGVRSIKYIILSVILLLINALVTLIKGWIQ